MELQVHEGAREASNADRDCHRIEVNSTERGPVAQNFEACARKLKFL